VNDNFKHTHEKRKDELVLYLDDEFPDFETFCKQKMCNYTRLM